MAGFDQVLAALRQMRETQDSKAKVYSQIGQNQGEALQGIGGTMKDLAGLYAGKKMAEQKDARAAEAAKAEQGWRSGLEAENRDFQEEQNRLDRENRLAIAKTGGTAKSPKDMWENLPVSGVLNSVAMGLGFVAKDPDTLKEKPDLDKLRTTQEGRDLAYQEIDRLIGVGQIPKESRNVYKQMVDAFFDYNAGSQGNGNNAGIVPSPEVRPYNPDIGAKEKVADNFMNPGIGLWKRMKDFYNAGKVDQAKIAGDQLQEQAKTKLEQGQITIDGYNRIIANIQSFTGIKPKGTGTYSTGAYDTR